MTHTEEQRLLEGIERIRDARYDLFDANELHYQVGRLLEAFDILTERNRALRRMARAVGEDSFDDDGTFVTVYGERLRTLLALVQRQEGVP